MLDIELTLKLVSLTLTVCSVVMFPAMKYIIGQSRRTDAMSARTDAISAKLETTCVTLDGIVKDFRTMQGACVQHQINTVKVQEKLDQLLRDVEHTRKALEMLRDVVYDSMLDKKQKRGGGE